MAATLVNTGLLGLSFPGEKSSICHSSIMLLLLLSLRKFEMRRGAFAWWKLEVDWRRGSLRSGSPIVVFAMLQGTYKVLVAGFAGIPGSFTSPKEGA